jgi:hypothetical protein
MVRPVIPVKAPAVLTLKALDTRAKVPVALPSEAVLAAPLAKVVLPVLVRVVKAPVEAVVAPIAVVLIPVAVVLKLPAVTVRLAAPVLIDEADRPDRLRAPEVAVRFRAPVVRVKPLLAVRVELALKVPVTAVLDCSWMLPAEFRVMLPEVVVVRLRLALVALRAVLMLVLLRLLSCWLA